MLPLARTICAGLPVMDAPLLSAFVDRWRPETHTFHLPCGEVTITMQDVVMILGLPLEGNAVTSIVQGDGWRDIVETSTHTTRRSQGQENLRSELCMVEAAFQPLSSRSS